MMHGQKNINLSIYIFFPSPVGSFEVSTFEDTFYQLHSPYKVSRDGFVTRQNPHVVTTTLVSNSTG